MVVRRIVVTEKVYDQCEHCEGTGIHSSGYVADCTRCGGVGEIKVRDLKEEYLEEVKE